MPDPDDGSPLEQIARQLRIRNAIELARLGGQLAWRQDFLDDVTKALHLTVNDIYPPEQKDDE
ncbi:MAG: hypothetical protein FWF90_16155 [Promicromonosporaceae bacterium]|nr:hypothetical protein [Promicromonosporaceae bacterium]